MDNLFIVKWRILLYMIKANNNSPVVYRYFRDLNLLDFGLKIVDKKSFKSYIKGCKSNLEVDELGKFIELSYNYANCFLKKYSSRYSKKLYSQPALFTILSLKIYYNMTYRKIVGFVNHNDRLKRFLSIKKAPNYSTLHKFFKRMPTKIFKYITQAIIEKLNLKPKIIAMDGSGFTSSHADKYYAKIIGNDYSHYTKCHITIDTVSRIVLHFQAIKGPRHDMKFSIASCRAIKRYKPKYILADKAYDSEELRLCINQELCAEEHIPTRGIVRRGYYRKLSSTRFNKKKYGKRNNVESVFSVIKRLFGGTNKSRCTYLQNKETKFKITAYNIVRSIQLSK